MSLYPLLTSFAEFLFIQFLALPRRVSLGMQESGTRSSMGGIINFSNQRKNRKKLIYTGLIYGD
jgi:hypothetical protein